MGAFSSKGLKVYISDEPGSATPTTVTSISNARPAVVTVGTSDIDSFLAGNLVRIDGSGIAALDGHVFPAGTIDDVLGTFTLVGSDATAATAAAAIGTATNIQGDMLEFCVATMEYAQQPGQAISVGTTCDPTAQLAGEPQPGTLSVTGFTDLLSPGYMEFTEALEDGLPRVIEVVYPSTANPPNGAVVVYPSATASGFTHSIGVGNAVSFTGEFTLGTKPYLRM